MLISEIIWRENSSKSDFAPSFYKWGLVYSSSRDSNTVVWRKHQWNEKPFLDLYVAAITSDGELLQSEKLSKKLNTKYHESTSTFTQDGNTIYFTRNYYYKKKYKKDKKGINKLKLFRATRNNDKWTNIEELSFNSDEYSVAHPALSKDEKQLYFASDMPGTYGQSDLYVVDIHEDGSFGEPKNLGSKINTEGRETFPFVSKASELYFASDGHIGLGGLDVFVTSLEGKDSPILNVGEPVNSSKDDFTFIIDSNAKLGYFASNREGGKGDDDIYSFVEITPVKWTCEQEIVGIVKDRKTNETVSEVDIALFNEKNQQLENTRSDEKGNFRFKELLTCNKVYSVRASKQLYNDVEVLLSKQKEAGLRRTTLLLEKEKVPFKIGDDLAKHLNIPIIRFDFNKYDIRPDAEVELAKLLAVMEDYPSLVVSIRSHTDSRGSDSYNEKLSKNRAESTRNYLISKGIAAERLEAKGYGEKQLVNRCSNGVKCSKEEHQLNRRSEFVVIKN